MKLIAGPCVVEDEKTTMSIARKLKKNLDPGIDFYFKASFKKANRTSIKRFTGLPYEESIAILKLVKEKLKLKICTDVHEIQDIGGIEDFVDVIQIPAFLCRQTDLIVAAAKTGKIVNIKKGQFMSPESMSFSIEKAINSGAFEVWVTERGTSFGYNDLIVDATSIPRLVVSCGCPVIMDVTHSLQKPNQTDGITHGSDKSLSRFLMRQAIVSGAEGIFMEVHTNPFESLSDKETILPIDKGISWANEAYKILNCLKNIKE